MSHDTVIGGGEVVGGTFAGALERSSVAVVDLDEDAHAVDRAVETGADAQSVENRPTATDGAADSDDSDSEVGA